MVEDGLRCIAANAFGICIAILLTGSTTMTSLDREGVTPLHPAAEYATYPIVILLLACGMLLLHWAALCSGCSSVASLLIDAYPEAVHLTDNSEHDLLPLHYAVMGTAHADVMRVLLEAYPDAIEIPSRMDKEMPLHIAVDLNASDAVVILLIDAHPETTHRALPLHIAAANHAQVVRCYVHILLRYRLKLCVDCCRFIALRTSASA